MGNYRFRLSDMMPNYWFRRPKDMGRDNRSQSIQHSMKKSQTSAASTASTATLPPIQHPKEQDYLPIRASYYIPSEERREKLPRSPINTKASDTHFPVEPPRKPKRKTRRKATKPCVSVVSSASCNCSRTLTSVCKSESIGDNQTYDDDNDLCKPIIANSLESDSCHVSSTTMFKKFEDLEVVSELKLPPILTKPVKKEACMSALHCTSVLKENNKTAARRSVSGIHGIKVRQNSPRVGSRKVQAYRKQNTAVTKVTMQQRSLSENLVVIKSSSNPMRDFMESMVEMIVENNIHKPKDLEELLACYLSLNSKEYQEVIIKVFEHIWFVLNDVKM